MEIDSEPTYAEKIKLLDKDYDFDYDLRELLETQVPLNLTDQKIEYTQVFTD